MKISRFSLKFITPCFCSGQNPLVAEIRESSVRGELRWWYRAVGGTKEQERAIFGGVGEHIAASSIRVRIINITFSDKSYQPNYLKPGDPGSYINYYLGASTETRSSRLWEQEPDTKKKGVVRKGAFIPHDSTFTLEIAEIRPIPSVARAVYDLAIISFLRFGSIGYRHTRGFGSWTCVEMIDSLDETKTAFQPLLDLADNFTAEWSEGSTSSDAVVNQIENRLKADKKTGKGLRFAHPAARPTDPPTALGCSTNTLRQQSAVRFRPFEFKTKSGDIQMRLLIFQGPDFLLDSQIVAPHRSISLKP